jgi:hypothetical protein
MDVAAITQVQNQLISKLELKDTYFQHLGNIYDILWTSAVDKRTVGEYILRRAFDMIKSKFDKVYAASNFLDITNPVVYSLLRQPVFDIVSAAHVYFMQNLAQNRAWRALHSGMNPFRLGPYTPNRVLPLTVDEQCALGKFAVSAYVESEVRQGVKFSVAVRKLDPPYVQSLHGRNWGHRPEYVEHLGTLMLQGRIINHRLGNTGTLNQNRNARNTIVHRALS